MTLKKRALAGLLLALPIVACTVSSPEDDDDGGSSSTGSGFATSSGTESNGATTGSGSMDEFCYDLDCNGDVTGRQCFADQEAYCQSLCAETNCLAPPLCEAECM